MTDNFRCDIFVSWHLYTKFLLGCQQLQRVLLWSIVIWTLCGAKLQAATESSTSPQLDENWSPSELLEQVTSVHNLENLDKEEFRYRLEPKPFLIAAPENFNPSLRILPPPPPPPPKPPKNSNPPRTSTEPVTPHAVLESIHTNFRYDTDNYGLENLFIEPTAQFRLRNGNKITFKTGFDYFKQRGVQSITNIPLQFGWVGTLTQQETETARQAWSYFQRNWNDETGLVNSVDRFTSVTMWDQAAAIAALVSARELNIVSVAEFEAKMRKMIP